MKPIKIVNSVWHISHDYALAGIPNTEWYFIVNNVKRWNYFARPFPKNVHYIPYYEKNKYSLAILHVDQQCIDPRIGKGQLYRAFNEEIQDIPKIVINHGSPCWPENWAAGGPKRWGLPQGIDDNESKEALEFQTNFLINGGKTLMGGELVEIGGMKKMIGDNKMVVNSLKAREQWGWGKMIWHGLDPDEWWDLPKEARSVTQVSAGGLDYYYGRDFLNTTITRLKEDFGMKHIWISHPNSWTLYDHPRLGEIGGFNAYRDYLGRSLIYFNPTKESPMPRSRTEAMLSGCCVLTTPWHDADKFINFDTRKIWANSEGIKDFISNVDDFLDTDGINGIIVPENPLAVAALIYHLTNYKFQTALKIGRRGKETAKLIFNKKRYDENWTEYIKQTLEAK